MRTASLLPALSALALLASAGCADDGWNTAMAPERLIDQLASDGHAISDDVVIPGALDNYNNPFDSVIPDAERRFDAMPLQGALAAEPWSDTYWPEHKGGIAYRWQRDESHDYRLLEPHELREMPPEAVAMLSPTEKYDLFAGATDYPLTKRVRDETGPDEAAWTGYCHGWANAGLHHAEPSPVTVTNDAGLEIRFGSSDIKALLTYFEGEVLKTTWGPDSLPFGRLVRGIGTSCGNGRMIDPGCQDLNPAGLHALLAHRIGTTGEGFVLEVDPTYERWNQPVHTYRSEVLGRRPPSVGAADTAVEERIVRTAVSWTMEIEPQWGPVAGTAQQVSTTRDFLYTLELDAAGQLVGGQWLYQAPSGDYLTMNTVWQWLRQADEDGDGSYDYSIHEASDVIRRVFTLVDLAWIQDPGDLPPEFEPVSSHWQLSGGGITTRKRLYSYLGKLPELL